MNELIQTFNLFYMLRTFGNIDNVLTYMDNQAKV